MEVPTSHESVLQYKKSLTHLYYFQSNRRGPFTWPAPTRNKTIQKLLSDYKKNLQYDQQNLNPNRDAHCVMRDSYKPAQLIKVLKTVWRSGTIREQFTISARHHMLLRDQDIRNLNFSDLFTTIIDKQDHRGTQQAVAVVFCIDQGKTLKPGEVKFACAIRHQNIHRCPVSALAFYLYSLLQVCK